MTGESGDEVHRGRGPVVLGATVFGFLLGVAPIFRDVPLAAHWWIAPGVACLAAIVAWRGWWRAAAIAGGALAIAAFVVSALIPQRPLAAFFAGFVALFLLWPALALAIVALAYAGAGSKVFQKSADGSITLACRLLLLPYRLGARTNIWAWTRNLAPQVAVADSVFLGRFPTASEANGFGTVIDLAAELERPAGATCRWIAFPMVDLLPPPLMVQQQAAGALEKARRDGTVLVCCALGFQRSAGVVAEWLVVTGRARTPARAREMLSAAGRPVHLVEATERAAS